MISRRMPVAASMIVALLLVACAEPVTIGPSVFLSGDDRRVMEIADADQGFVELVNQGPGTLRLEITERSVDATAQVQLGVQGMYRAEITDTRRIVLINDSGESTTVGWTATSPVVELHP